MSACGSGLLAGCVYFNTLYNASELYRETELARLAGQDSALAERYSEVIDKATRAYRADERGRWSDDALLLMGQAHLRRGDLRDALEALERVLAVSEDPVVRCKLAHFYTSVETQRLNNLRMRATASATSDPGPIGSIFKIIWATANQDLLELAVDILGPYAELMPKSDAHDDIVGQWMHHFLRSRANTIEGGTSEILKEARSCLPRY